MNDTTTIKKSLLCSLSDDERRTYGIKLATTLEDIETVEADKKRQTDHFKDRIAGLQANADQLRHKVSTGQEWRDIECTVIFGQPTPDRKQIIRPDTGEVVETTWMTESEKQRELPLVIEGDDEDTAGDDDGVIDVESEPVTMHAGGEMIEVEGRRQMVEIVEDDDDDAAPVVVDESKPAKSRRKKPDADAPMPADDTEAPQPADSTADDY
jgi:hypothetical protein